MYSDYASLSLSPDKNQQPVAVDESYCALFNPTYTSLPTRARPDAKDFHRAFFLKNSHQLDPFCCEDLPTSFQKELSVVADRGNCTFYRKALVAQRVNASLLVVVYDTDMVTLMPNLSRSVETDPSISIPVLLVSNATGEEIIVSVCVIYDTL